MKNVHFSETEKKNKTFSKKVPRNLDNKMPSSQKESSSFENMKDTSRAVDIDITENCINIIQICKEVLSMNVKEKTLQELLKDIRF